MLIVKATCPNCGAPLSLTDGQRYVICAYCDLSLLVDLGPRTNPTTPAEPVNLSAAGASADDIRRVKQLIFEGKRPEAVRHYAAAASLSLADAEAAVSSLIVPELLALYRQMPLNAVGFLSLSLLIFAAAGGAAFGCINGAEGFGYVVLALVCGLLVALLVRTLAPKALSTLVDAFGTRGQARVVKRVTVHTFPQGHHAVLLLFEVRPADGGAPFFDEEPLLVRAESWEKLAPGNVVWVRYDEPKRRRVFPESPVQVVG